MNAAGSCVCPVGTYLKSSACLSCPTNCATCADTTGVCTQPCPSTYVWSVNTCACPAG